MYGLILHTRHSKSFMKVFLGVLRQLHIHARINEQLKNWLVNPLHAPIDGDREVALNPYREVLWDRHTLRVQVASSPHIILLNIELVALKLDLATHGINPTSHKSYLKNIVQIQNRPQNQRVFLGAKIVILFQDDFDHRKIVSEN